MDVLELAALVAVIFALLSFLNTLGMHWAIRQIRKRVDAFLTDPAGETFAAFDDLMSDPEKKTGLEMRLQWVGRNVAKGGVTYIREEAGKEVRGSGGGGGGGLLGGLLKGILGRHAGLLGDLAGGFLGGGGGGTPPPRTQTARGDPYEEMMALQK